jgi:pimeloyl-ACP methyl ester carboxylesterase
MRLPPVPAFRSAIVLLLIAQAVLAAFTHVSVANAADRCLTNSSVQGANLTGPAGRALILLQGFDTSASSVTEQDSTWSSIIPALADYYSNIVFYSYNPNSAESYSSKDTYQSVQEHHVSLLHQTIADCPAKGISSIDIVGHSMGGVVAYEYLKQSGTNGDQAGMVKHLATLDSPLNGLSVIALPQKYAWVQQLLPPSLADSTAGLEFITMHNDAGLRSLNVDMAQKMKLANVQVRTITNAQDIFIRKADATINGFQSIYQLGNKLFARSADPLDRIGHGQVLTDAGVRAEIRNFLNPLGQ